MDETNLVQTIERLRLAMVETALEKGSLVEPSVVAISQQLDTLIVQLQRMKMNRFYKAG